MITKIVVRNLRNYKEVIFEFNKENDNVFFTPIVNNYDDVIMSFYKSFEFLDILKDILNFISPEYYIYDSSNKFNRLLKNVPEGEILLFTIFYDYEEENISLSFAISELGILYEKLEINNIPIIEYDGEDVILSKSINKEDKESIKVRYDMAYTKTGFYKSNSVLISSILETETLKKYLKPFKNPQLYFADSSKNKYDIILSYLKILSSFSGKDSDKVFQEIIHSCENFLLTYFPDHIGGEYAIDESNLCYIYNSSFGKKYNYFNIAGNGFCKFYWKLLMLIGTIKSDFYGIIIFNEENFDEGLHPKLSSELLKVFNMIGKDKDLFIITNLYDKGIDNSNKVNKLNINFINYETEKDN